MHNATIYSQSILNLQVDNEWLGFDKAKLIVLTGKVMEGH